MLLGGPQGAEAPLVGPQLFHCPGAERVTRRNQNSVAVLDQPEGDLDPGREKSTGSGVGMY